MRRSTASAPLRVPVAWRRRRERTDSLLESFYHAFCGIGAAFRGERQVKIHSVLAVVAIAGGLGLGLDAISWGLLIFAIGMVLTAELLNTAIERVVDIAAEGEYSNLARDAKDIAAGAVLLAATSALAIGLVVFSPKLVALLM